MHADGVSCSFCGENLGSGPGVRALAGLRVTSNAYPLAERLRAWNVALVESPHFVLVERACPSCGTLVDVTIERSPK
jgi:hypothetical protein